MRGDPVRILLVAGDDVGRCLVEEALAEMSERSYRSPCLRPSVTTPVFTPAQALELVRRESFDVALVDLAGAEGPRACSLLLEAAPGLPVIGLASPDEEALALGLVRRGMQDYLLRTEIDCLPLARAIATAIERQRLLGGWRGLAMVDELTGLPNAAAFESLVRRHWAVAGQLGQPLAIALVESGSAEAMELIGAAEALRCAFRAGDVLARIGERRFAVAAIGAGSAAAARLETIPLRAAVGVSRPGAMLEDLLASVERSLWENKLEPPVASAKSGAA
jgi:GGDEF domain-containing protein